MDGGRGGGEIIPKVNIEARGETEGVYNTQQFTREIIPKVIIETQGETEGVYNTQGIIEARGETEGVYNMLLCNE